MKGETLWPGHPFVAPTLPPALPGTSHQVCGTEHVQIGDKFHLISPTNLLTCCIEIPVLRHAQASEREQGDEGLAPSTLQICILCFILSGSFLSTLSLPHISLYPFCLLPALLLLLYLILLSYLYPYLYNEEIPPLRLKLNLEHSHMSRRGQESPPFFF